MCLAVRDSCRKPDTPCTMLNALLVLLTYDLYLPSARTRRAARFDGRRPRPGDETKSRVKTCSGRLLSVPAIVGPGAGFISRSSKVKSLEQADKTANEFQTKGLRGILKSEPSTEQLKDGVYAWVLTLFVSYRLKCGDGPILRERERERFAPFKPCSKRRRKRKRTRNEKRERETLPRP